MNLLSSLLTYTARQIAALRAKDSSQDTEISGAKGRLTTAESNISTLTSRIETAISAVTTSTEVTDIRVGDDGVTYGTAGTAVRTQFSNLKSELNNISEYGTNLFDASDATDYKRLANDGTLIDATTGNTCFVSDYIEVEPNTIYYKNAPAEASYYRTCYYDSTKTFITGAQYETRLSTAPATAKYARFCGYMTGKSQAIFVKVTAKDYDARRDISEIEADITEINSEMVDVEDRLNHVVKKVVNLYDSSAQMEGYQLWSNGSLGANADYNFSGYIDVSGCEKITVYLYGMHIGNYCQRAFYDSSKSPVSSRETDLNGSAAVTFDVPSGAKYFGFAYPIANWTTTQGKAMVEKGTDHNDWLPYGTPRYIITPSDNNASVLVYWGDSLTEGNQAGDGGSIPTYMQSMLNGWTVYNFGRGGDMANAIACRQGGMNYVVKADQTIPASGSVTLDLTDNIGSTSVGIRMYDGAVAYDSFEPVEIAGVKGKLLRVSSSYELNQGVFTRTTNGSAVSLDRPVGVISNGENYRGYPVIISAGTNAGFDTSKPQELVDIIRWMVEHANTDKYIVMGLYHGTNNAWQANANKALQAEFGRHFLDAETYMKTIVYSGDTVVSSYAMEDENLTPDATDLTNIANHAYPPSIMYDSTHFNKYGYECIAKLQYKRGQELGYWD